MNSIISNKEKVEKKYKIRRQKANKVKKIIRKFFGGLDCGTYNTQKQRRDCNIVLKNNLFLDKYSNCSLITDTIKLNNVTIKFEKKIGEGHFGKAYLSSIKYKNELYNFIVKEQKITNENPEIQLQNELIIIKYLSQLVEKNISPHFLHFYTEVLCDSNIKMAGEPEGLKKPKPKFKPMLDISLMTESEEKRYFIVEKASAALSSLKNTLRYHFKSIITQIILSIFTFHQYTKCYHLDTHHGNFLVHELKYEKNMFIKYKLDKNIYKLNVSKYLVILWDYGIVQGMKNTSFLNYTTTIQNIYWTKLIYDYYRIFSIISDDKYYQKNKEQYKILRDIIILLNEYNQKIKYTLKKLYNVSKEIQIQNILQIEKEFLYRLIQEKIIFNSTNISNEYYNGLPYELENIQGIIMNPLKQENTSVLNEKFDGNMPEYDYKLIQKLKNITSSS